MTSLTFIFKLITTFWPFFREWAFGGKTVMQSLKERRVYTILVIGLLIVTPLAVWEGFRLMEVSSEVAANRSKLKAYEHSCPQLTSKFSAFPTPKSNINYDMQGVASYLECRETEGECD